MLGSVLQNLALRLAENEELSKKKKDFFTFPEQFFFIFVVMKLNYSN